MKIVFLATAALLALLAVGCSGDDDTSSPTSTLGIDVAVFSMQSNAFAEGADVPERYTCDGDNLSPSLFWEEPPDGTESFALTMVDPDAPGGSFVHWVYFNIPGDARSLPEAIETADEPSTGGLQVESGFGEIGYGGPCPPEGPEHRYVFTLMALGENLTLGPDASFEDVRDQAEQGALAQATLTGLYGR